MSEQYNHSSVHLISKHIWEVWENKSCHPLKMHLCCHTCPVAFTLEGIQSWLNHFCTSQRKTQSTSNICRPQSSKQKEGKRQARGTVLPLLTASPRISSRVNQHNPQQTDDHNHSAAASSVPGASVRGTSAWSLSCISAVTTKHTCVSLTL